MKIAVLEPYIEGIGGAQRAIAEYSNYLKSIGHEVEIWTQRYDKENSYPEFKNLKINLLKPSFKILIPFIYLFKKFKKYDVIISNDWPSNFSSIRNKNTLWICYSPKRNFYDLKEYYWKEASFYKKIELLLKRLFFYRLDIISAKKTKIIASISKNVQERVKKYYSKDSYIFYIGSDYKYYKKINYQNYFLSVARLEKPKRVDIIVKSMSYLKNKNCKLFIIGDGKEKQDILGLCKNHDNTIFLGKVSDEELLKKYQNCRGVICIPVNEDWGLIPIEAATFKKTTIGVNEGGLKETIINKKTGFLIDNIDAKKLAEKIDILASNKRLAKKMGEEANIFCQKFAWKNLMKELDILVEKTKN